MLQMQQSQGQNQGMIDLVDEYILFERMLKGAIEDDPSFLDRQ